MRSEVDRALIKQLSEALYAVPDDVSRVLRFMSGNLTRLWNSEAAPMRNVDRVVGWAEDHGRLADLVNEMREVLKTEAFEQLARQIRAQLDELAAVNGAGGVAPAQSPAPKRSYQMVVFGMKSLDSRTIDGGPPRPIFLDALSLDTAKVLRRIHTAQSPLRDEELQILGTHLFHILFGAPDRGVEDGRSLMLKRLAQDCRRLDEDPQGYLQIVLQFTSTAAELALLPWEYLFIPPGILATPGRPDEAWPAEGFFLTEHDRISLSRAQGSSKPAAIGDRVAPPLKVLVVDCRTRPPDTAAESPGWMTKTFERIQWSPLLPSPARRTLEDECKKVQVVHFIGSGQTVDEQVTLQLGRGVALSGEEISDTLRGVRLVVFHAERAEFSTEFCRIAIKLMPAGPGGAGSTPSAVVVVQLDPLATELFSEELYSALGRGEPVEFALQSARRKLGKARGEFGRPMLLQSGWGALIDDARPPAPQGLVSKPAEDTRPRGLLDARVYGVEGGVP